MSSDAAAFEKLEEERRLVEEAQKGNLDAMRPIFQSYAGALYGSVILQRLGDAAAGEDVLRDTFITAIERIDRFRWTGRSIYAWLRQIAINKVYDVHRRAQRSLKLAESVARESPRHSDATEQADALLIAAEERELSRARIEQTMATIPERYRRAIELRLIDELPREECARQLGVSTATFDVVLYRAVRAFRKRFGDRG